MITYLMLMSLLGILPKTINSILEMNRIGFLGFLAKLSFVSSVKLKKNSS